MSTLSTFADASSFAAVMTMLLQQTRSKLKLSIFGLVECCDCACDLSQVAEGKAPPCFEHKSVSSAGHKGSCVMTFCLCTVTL